MSTESAGGDNIQNELLVKVRIIVKCNHEFSLRFLGEKCIKLCKCFAIIAINCGWVRFSGVLRACMYRRDDTRNCAMYLGFLLLGPTFIHNSLLENPSITAWTDIPKVFNLSHHVSCNSDLCYNTSDVGKPGQILLPLLQDLKLEELFS